MDWGRLPVYQRRVAPKVLEAVERAFVPVKNVDNDLQIIEHHPLTAWKAVDRHRANRMVLSQPRFNFVRNCF